MDPVAIMNTLLHLIGIAVDFLTWLSWVFVNHSWLVVGISCVIGLWLPAPRLRTWSVLPRLTGLFLALGASSFGVFLSVSRHAFDVNVWLPPNQRQGLHVDAPHWSPPSLPFGAGNALQPLADAFNKFTGTGSSAINQVASIDPKIRAALVSAKVMETFGTLTVIGSAMGFILLIVFVVWKVVPFWNTLWANRHVLLDLIAIFSQNRQTLLEMIAWFRQSQGQVPGQGQIPGQIHGQDQGTWYQHPGPGDTGPYGQRLPLHPKCPVRVRANGTLPV